VSDVEGTSDMSEYVRKVLEEHQREIVVPDRANWYGAKWELAGWPRFIPAQPMKIIITDVS
jgi:hypothetical protein